jgi:hypothetical protein
LALVLALAVVAGTLPLGVACAQALSAEEQQAGFLPLCNGKDLTGWIVEGEPSWSVQDGVIHCAGGGGGWLRSAYEYENFVWRLEYKISPEGNSGLFIRATREGNPAFTGMEIQVLDDYGQEPDTHSAGALYDSIAPAVNASRPAGEWNEVEVTCLGRGLRVVMNGSVIIDANLDDYPELRERARWGYIGVQNHGSGVDYRNMRMLELDFNPLFNGKDLSGWKVIGPECWSAVDGVLRCTGEGGGWIHTERECADFDLRLEYKISEDGNSGIFLRAPDEGEPWRTGFEVQILDDFGDEPPDTHNAGAIYDIVAPSKNMSKPTGEWNQAEVICRGRQLTVILNGECVIDVNLDSDPRLQERAAKGYLGVQNHGNLVEFRDLRVREF